MSESGLQAWIDRSARIVSFHPVDGYEYSKFEDYDKFVQFLCMLMDRSYRFQ